MTTRLVRIALAIAIVAAAGLQTMSVHAFDGTDAAGINGLDTPSGGPPFSSYYDVGAVCGAPCRLNAADDQIIPLRPPSGQPNFPFRWSSGVSTPGIAGSAGNSDATVWVDTNGYVTFMPTTTPTFSPTGLPNAASPNAIVAGAWLDLNPAAAAASDGIFWQILGSPGSRRMVIQWRNVPSFSPSCQGPSGFTFEIVLHEAGNMVDVIYGLNRCTALRGVGGQENSAGAAGITYFDGTSIPDDIAIRYRDVIAPATTAPVVACGTPGVNGWCRSSQNTATMSDDNDTASGAQGLGVQTRTWRLNGIAQGSYTSGVGVPFTAPDGTHSVSSSVSDYAGNSSSSPSVQLKVDATAPTLSGTATTAPNALGWYKGDVTINWSCSDATSGVASCPAPDVIAGEGINLTASRSITDNAGNPASATSPAVKIDRTAPATVANAPAGWTTSHVVTLTGSDNLSGVDSTWYSIDGLPPAQGTQATIPNGVHTLEFYSIDKAGNQETPVSVTVKVDDAAPVITHTVSPVPNPAGWTKSAATVTFQCDDAHSFVVFCSPPASFPNDGAGQTAMGTAQDAAGNTANTTAVVNVDTTPPSITAARVPAANANGWNNVPVTVTYSCGDALSGVTSCAAVQTFGQGANQTASGVAADAAGNTATAAVTGINVDTTPPTVTGAPLTPPNSYGWHKGDVIIKWTCSDALSGVVSCPADTLVSGTGANLTVNTPPVLDRAGNATIGTATVKIDRLPPAIQYYGQTPAANAAGWNRADVTMSWLCSDDLSGALVPSVAQAVTGETPGADRTGTCTDRAGWSVSDTQGPVRIDKTAPVAAVLGPGLVPAITNIPVVVDHLGGYVIGTSSDALSGTRSVLVTVENVLTGGTRTLVPECFVCGGSGVGQWRVPASMIGLGFFRVSAASTDVAGNQGAASPPVLILVAAV